MIYLKNEIQNVINASGRMTKLGVSTQSEAVLEAMNYGASHYFLMDDLHKAAGSAIADLLHAKDAVITSSASAGIALSVATVICKQDAYYIQHHRKIKDSLLRQEIVLAKGHNVNFGAPVSTMIESGGGIVVEAGYANQATMNDVEVYINDNTAALLYVKSSHCVQKDMLSIAEMFALAKKYDLPMILDCAAEVDFFSFAQMGIDYVIYSGSKALMGPTSGFVLTQSSEDAVEMRKHLYGIGRSMKLGKENIFGLVQAVYEFVHGVDKQVVSDEDLMMFIKAVNQIEGLQANKVQDESGRKIYRAKVFVDEAMSGICALDLIKELEQGSPQIFTRNYDALQGYISFDPRPLQSLEDLYVILNRLKEIIGNAEIL